jgi:hypothetical protein
MIGSASGIFGSPHTIHYGRLYADCCSIVFRVFRWRIWLCHLSPRLCSPGARLRVGLAGVAKLQSGLELTSRVNGLSDALVVPIRNPPLDCLSVCTGESVMVQNHDSDQNQRTVFLLLKVRP